MRNNNYLSLINFEVEISLLGAMAMKGYSKFLKLPKKPCHQMV